MALRGGEGAPGGGGTATVSLGGMTTAFVSVLMISPFGPVTVVTVPLGPVVEVVVRVVVVVLATVGTDSLAV